MHRLFFILIIVLLNPCLGHAQADSVSVKHRMLNNAFGEHEYHAPAKRPLLGPRKSFFAKINPLNYLAAGLLFVYQNILSEQVQARCMYEISCSEYAKLAIKQHGFIRGTLKGADQLNNCFKQVIYDYPNYKITENLKVNNQPLNHRGFPSN